MATLNQCPTCGSDVAVESPSGLCSNCVAVESQGGQESLPETIFADQATAAITDAQRTPPVSPSLPPTLSGYMIIGPPMRGGMGTVWPAKQLGTRRTVAIKILGTQHLTPEGQARFQREVELSAQLQHPNIIRIYDSGIHEGDYYYAMELIDGLSLDRYVAKHKPSQKQILEIMRLICLGVQHAHVRRVIHCDLKPSNIVVSEDGQPHVLDFGLARLISTRPDGLTESGSAPGTPSYMSPEQAAGWLHQIDTRSDVYSLGKILYELLTGQPAHRRDGTMKEFLHQVATEPVRPPREVSRKLNRELSAVLLKALDRDQEKRYSLAGELARDIEHYQQGQPVAAVGLSIGYQLRKWMQRRRLAVGVAAAALLVLIAVGVSSLMLIRQEAVRTARRSQFNERLLHATDPAKTGRDMIDELVDCARAASIEFADEPLIEADLLERIATSLFTFGRLEQAQQQFQTAVNIRQKKQGPDHVQTLAAKERLAQVSRERGEFELAERMCNDIFQSRSGEFGEGHHLTQRAKIALAQVLEDRALLGGEAEALGEAEILLRDAVRVCKRDFGDKDSDTLAAKAALVPVLRVQGGAKLAEADVLSQETLAARASINPTARPTLESMHDRANVLVALGRPKEALEIFDNLMKAAIVLPGWSMASNPDTTDHPDLLLWMNDWAYALSVEKRFKEASKILKLVLPRSINARGADHPFNVVIQQNLAATLIGVNKWDEGEKLFAEAADARAKKMGADHLETIRLRELEAWAMTGQGKWIEAERIYRHALKVREEKLPAGDPAIELARKRLAAARSHLEPTTEPETQPHK